MICFSILEIYETLNKKNSDRYQFILPFITLTKSINRENSLVFNLHQVVVIKKIIYK